MPKRVRSIGPIARQNELLQKACAYLDNSTTKEKEIPPIAIAWGEKLLQLHPQQRNFAEKAVNDVLFEACQGTLHRNSVKINEGFSYPSSITSPTASGDTSTFEQSPHHQGSSSTQCDSLVSFFTGYQ